VGCSQRVALVVRQGRGDVAILTRRERRVQLRPPASLIASIRPGCDPHPTRTSGAALGNAGESDPNQRLRSSPDANVGCSVGLFGEVVAAAGGVAILTRRERRVQLSYVETSAALTQWLRSSPDANVGCSQRRQPRQPRQQEEVAILTRRERRVQPAGRPWGGAPGRLVAILTRRERRVQPQSRSTIGFAMIRLRSSPDANVGC